jgi:hypothetical protein
VSAGSTWALLVDVRARIAAYDPTAYVSPIMGQVAPSDTRDKLVEIIEVSTAEIDNTTHYRDFIRASRTVHLQAFRAIGAQTTPAGLAAAEQSAGEWFDGLRDALINYTGDSWAIERKIRFLDEPVAMGRDGAFLVYRLRFTTQVPISVGTHPVPPPPPP